MTTRLWLKEQSTAKMTRGDIDVMGPYKGGPSKGSGPKDIHAPLICDLLFVHLCGDLSIESNCSPPPDHAVNEHEVIRLASE